jgi:hypothetical protein
MLDGDERGGWFANWRPKGRLFLFPVLLVIVGVSSAIWMSESHSRNYRWAPPLLIAVAGGLAIFLAMRRGLNK